MATAIRCGICGFTFGFVENDDDWLAYTCPNSKVETLRIAVPEDGARVHAESGRQWFVVDRFEQPVAGPFPGPERATLWVTRNRLWDHPCGPLDIKPATVGTVVVPPGTVAERTVEPLGRERHGDPAFWTASRLAMLGRLWYFATQPEDQP